MSETAHSASAFEAFLVALSDDLERGEARPLAEYLARFPGCGSRARQAYSDMVVRLAPISHPQSAPVEPAASAIGRLLGPYRLVRELGRGGQGVVFLAEDTRLGRRVALKVMTAMIAASPQTFARFKREAAAASKVDHPGISTIFDAGEDGGTHYIVMRYIDGETLAQRIGLARARGPDDVTSAVTLPPGAGRRDTGVRASGMDESVVRVVQLIEDAARALHAAHLAGVIHRDVKPGNIMVCPDGRPTILDFGLALDTFSDLPAITQSGDLFGTPAYMSPEQVRGTGHASLDARTDVFSLGVTLFECLTLRRPFDHPTRDALIHAIQHEDPDPRRINAAISRDLATVIQKAMEKDPAHRYQTALELAEDLRRVRADLPILARPAAWPVRVRRWIKRHRVITAAAALGCVAIVATATLMPKRGMLRLTSASDQVRIELVPVGGGDARTWVLPVGEDLSLTPGEYRLAATKKDHLTPPVRTIRILSGAVTPVHVTLEPFNPKELRLSGGAVLGNPQLADFDQDGRLDLVAGLEAGEKARLEAFSVELRRPIWSTGWSGSLGNYSIGQLDADDVQDVAVLGVRPSRLAVLSGRDGMVSWSEDLPEEQWLGLSVSDLDADGSDDLVIVSTQGSVQAWSPRRSVQLWPTVRVPSRDGLVAPGVIVFREGGEPRIVVGPVTTNRLAGEPVVIDGTTGRVMPLANPEVATSWIGPPHAGGAWLGTVDGRVGRIGDGRVELFGDIRDDPCVRVLDTSSSGDPRRSVLAVFESGTIVAVSDAGPGPLRQVLGEGRRVHERIATVCLRADGDLGDLILASMVENANSVWMGARVDLIPLGTGTPESMTLDGLLVGNVVAGDFDNDGATEPIISTYDFRTLHRPPPVLVHPRGTGLLWRAPTTGPIWSSPAIADLTGDGRPEVVIGSKDKCVYAFSGEDGSVVWKHATGDVVEGRPAVCDLDGDGIGDVVIGSDDGRLYALSGRSGSRVWEPFATSGKVFAKPAIADFDCDGRPDVACASLDGGIYILRGRDGTLMAPPLRVEGNSGFRSSPLVADLDGDPTPDLVIGSMDGRLCGFSGKGGTPIWTVPIAREGASSVEKEVRSSPASAELDGDHIVDYVVGGADGYVYAVRGGATPDVLWREPVNALPVNSSPWLSDLDGDGVKDVVIGGSEDRDRTEGTGRGCCVTALSGPTGKRLWSFRTQGGTWSSPRLTRFDDDPVDDVLIGSEDGFVYLLSGRDGAPIHRYPVLGRIYSSPDVGDLNGDGSEEVVVGSFDDHHVYAFSLRAEHREGRKRVPAVLRARENLAAHAYEAALRASEETPDIPRELRLVRAWALIGLERDADAAREIDLAAAAGLRSGVAGGLQLLLALRTGRAVDLSVVASSVDADPIAFLEVLITPSRLRDAVSPEAVRQSLATVRAAAAAPDSPNRRLREAVLRLLLGEAGPVSGAQGMAPDPVRTDYARTTRALARLLSGDADASIGGATTLAGQRFEARWGPDAAAIRRLLRLPPP